jgi:hypothetical protein
LRNQPTLKQAIIAAVTIKKPVMSFFAERGVNGPRVRLARG